MRHLALLPIWRSFQTEEPMNFEGEFYTHNLMTPFFNPGPIEHPQIPVYIAGVNTRMCRVWRVFPKLWPAPP